MRRGGKGEWRSEARRSREERGGCRPRRESTCRRN